MSEWISVEEELPKLNGNSRKSDQVEVVCMNDKYPTVELAYYHKVHRGFVINSQRVRPTHWKSIDGFPIIPLKLEVGKVYDTDYTEIKRVLIIRIVSPSFIGLFLCETILLGTFKNTGEGIDVLNPQNILINLIKLSDNQFPGVI